MLRVRLWRWISATARSNRTSATWASGANFPFVELTYTRSKSAGLARPLRASRTTTGRESPSPSRRLPASRPARPSRTVRSISSIGMPSSPALERSIATRRSVRGTRTGLVTYCVPGVLLSSRSTRPAMAWSVSSETLQAIAGRVERLLKATPGTQYVTNPVRVARIDLRVAIDRAKAGLLGIPMLEIDRTVRLGIAGLEAGSLREGDGDARPVVVRLARTGRASPADLERVYVSSTNGKLTPLAQVAEVRFERAVAEIQRHNRTRSITVTANVRTGYNTDRVTQQALGRLGGVAVPL